MDQWDAINLSLWLKVFIKIKGWIIETFSPVLKPTTIQIVLSLALTFSWSLQQLYVYNAFLNGDLVEDVFMEHPVGFVYSVAPMHDCKLRKALYVLKQSPRAWYNKLSSCLLQWGFTIPNLEPLYLFYKLAHQLLS